MSNPLLASTHQPTLHSRSFDLRLLLGLAALALGALMAIQLLPLERVTEAAHPGRVLAFTPAHGTVAPGKQLAENVKFPSGGVKPGKLGAVH